VLARDKTLSGRRVLVTAGPTYEDFDPVRFVGNRSSGRMGYAIAAELAARGAEVVLVTGPTTLSLPAVKSVVRTRTAEEMRRAVNDVLPAVDALVMAAAVANYRPQTTAAQKIAHEGGPLTLTLVPTADILADAAAWRRREGRERPLLVGFAAETHDVVERARAKRLRKGIDVIIANDVLRSDAGFEVETNAVTILTDDGDESLPLQSKTAVAAALADRLERWLKGAPAPAESRS
jgi:phosphopantothenoylcysteine decarboxylase / phosphopantothenate---cysteine ligase